MIQAVSFSKKLKKYWPDLLITAASLILCLLAFFNVIIPQDVFGWDQSHHTLYGSWIANDIQGGDWTLFWEHTHRQTLWPFFHSWVLGIFLLFFGISYVSARTFHLIVFFLLLVSTWHVGKALDEKNGKLIGAIAWGFLVVSPYFWSIGIDVLIEVVAALVTIYIFYSLIRLEQTRKWIWIIPLGILMAIIMVIKYNFAMTIYLSVFLWASYELISNLDKLLDRSLRTRFTNLFFLKYLLIFLPSLLMFWWWMYGPNSENKWHMVWYSKSEWVAKSDQVPGFWNNFLYYFKQLVVSYNAWYPAIGVLILIGFVGFFFLLRKRNTSLILLACFTWGTMPVHIWVLMNKVPRYIYNIVPLIYLAAAIFWISIWEIAKEKLGAQRARIFTIILLASLAAHILVQSGPMVAYFSGKANKGMGERYMEVLDYFAKAVPEDAPIASGSELVELSPYTFDFHFRHHVQGRTAPVFNKYSLQFAKFQKGMYLVAFMKDPTPEKLKEDPWYRLINANLSHLEQVDSKYFSKLNLRTDIYRIK